MLCRMWSWCLFGPPDGNFVLWLNNGRVADTKIRLEYAYSRQNHRHILLRVKFGFLVMKGEIIDGLGGFLVLLPCLH